MPTRPSLSTKLATNTRISSVWIHHCPTWPRRLSISICQQVHITAAQLLPWQILRQTTLPFLRQILVLPRTMEKPSRGLCRHQPISTSTILLALAVWIVTVGMTVPALVAWSTGTTSPICRSTLPALRGLTVESVEWAGISATHTPTWAMLEMLRSRPMDRVVCLVPLTTSMSWMAVSPIG